MKQQMRIVKQSSQFALILMAVIIGMGLSLFQPTTAKADTLVPGCAQLQLDAAIFTEPAGGRVYYTTDCTVNFSAQSTITKSIIIDGNGFNVIFDGGGVSRILNIDSGGAGAYTVELRRITLQNGKDNGGGAIRIQNNGTPTLVLTGTKFLTNTANTGGNRGGAIFNNGSADLTLNIINSDFINNVLLGTSIAGGAIYIGDVTSTTIENSNFTDNIAIQSGGAIYINGTTPMYINNSTFTNNRVTSSPGGNGGGAIYSNSSGVTNIYNATFTNNTQTTSGQHGGAMYINSGTTNIYTSTFTNNRVTVGNGSGGAIMFNGGTALNIYNSNVISNRSFGGSGGAIYIVAPTTIQNSSFISNNASINGGALYASGGTASVTIRDSTFITNATTGSGGGGALYYSSSTNTMNIYNSTLSNNTTVPGQNGGAIYHNTGTTNIYNSTLYNNRAPTTGAGGAIYEAGGTVTVYHSTIINNSTGTTGSAPSSTGGGIRAAGGTASLINTLIAFNTAINAANGNCNATLTNSSSSFTDNVGNCSGSSPTLKTNLNLGSLGNYGGNTQTIPLFAGSDAIDTAASFYCNSTYNTNFDQRGIARPSGSACDVGAYEFVRPTLSISTTTSTIEGSPAVFTASLSFPISQAVTIYYTTTMGTASAAAGDYTSCGNCSLTVAAGATIGTGSVTTLNDATYESTETFIATFGTTISGSATFSGSNISTATIIDDDSLSNLIISADTANVTEPISSTDTLPITFTVQLVPASGTTVTVNYTVGGTAINGVDFETFANGTLTFTPGQLLQTVVITTIGDLAADGNRTVIMNLSGESNATINTASATTTIIDSDGAPQIFFASDVSQNEGNTGSTVMEFTVNSSIPPGPGNVITITYYTADGTASASGDNDYTASSGTVLINSGESFETISIPIIGDTKDENNETLTVNINTSTPGVTVSDAQAIGTITNDDLPPVAKITNVELISNTATATEGNSGTNSMAFAVVITQASAKTIAIKYTTVNSTAIAGLDYVTKSGTLNFTPGNTGPQYIFVDVMGDTIDELNENFQVSITSTTATILTTTNTATGTIIDDDTATVSIDNITQDEGNFGVTNFIFTVNLSTASDRPITVAYQTQAGTATADVDYQEIPSATLTLNPTATQSQITAVITPDLALENDETFFVKIISATNATVPANTQGKGTILDDDPFASIGISDVTVTEGLNSQAIFTVTLTPPVLVDTTVSYSTLDNSAKAGLDYSFLSGTVTIPAGTSQKTVAIPIMDDVLKENTESFFVNLSNSTGPQIGDAQGIGTILDDDEAVTTPTLSIANSSLTEEDNGTQTMLFTVTLSITPGEIITVDYNTVDGTAKAGSDYTGKGGTLTFVADGTRVQTFTVAIMGDILDEFDETFSVQLTDPQNAILDQATAIGSIKDNDTTVVTIGSNASVTEGDSGTATVNLPLSLSLLSDHDVTVRYSTIDDTATSGSDYIFQTNVITFSPGDTQETISLAVMGDKLDELDETFSVQLSQPNQLIINNATGIVTIKDDDNTTMSINDVTILEGNSGTTNAQFIVSLSLMSDQVITVNYSTASDTATASRPGVAVNNPDYMESQGVVTFSPMITSQVINIPILGDTTFESDEIYYVNLAKNAITLTDNQGKGVILNDDPHIGDLPTAFITNMSLVEGDSGLKNAILTVTLVPLSKAEISIDYTFIDGTATAGSDYQGIPGTITFAPNAATQNITVPIIGDFVSESDETFSVSLVPTTSVVISDVVGNITILNDDSAEISIEPAIIVQEGQAPNEAVFQVTLSRSSDRLVAVEYKTVNETATAGSDFVAQNAFLSFNPGETVQTIHVPIIDDSDVEAIETFKVVLSTPTRATIATSESVASIRDNDGSPTVYMDALQITEGDSGTKEAIFNLTIWPTATTSAHINYATVDGTAQAGSDYQAVSSTLNIAVNSASAHIMVPIMGDMVDEFDESFSLKLTDALNVAIITDSVEASIMDDDTAQLSMRDIFALNGPNGSGMATFTVILSLISDHDIVITYHTQNGKLLLSKPNVTPSQTSGSEDALSGQDFITQTGTITIPAGQLSETITIPILDNTIPDSAKIFTLVLDNADMAQPVSALGIILDDDGPSRLYVSNSETSEGNDGQSMAAFTVQLWPTTSQVALVNYATADGVVAGQEARTSDTDYEATSGQLTFIPNGSSSQTISVPINGDIKVEMNEQFMVNLSNAIGADLGLSQGVGTILNDDFNPITISDAQTDEGDSGSHTLAFTVTLATASDSTVMVDYATVANSATESEDFEPASGTLSIAPGQTIAFINIKVNGDTTVEFDENFSVKLSNPVNTTLIKGEAIGTIRNDDVKPVIKVYIPLIMKQPVITPDTPTPTPGPADLIVQNIVATNNRVEVTIKNIGGETIPTSQAFWVEFYVNPNPVPNAVNQSWRGRSTEGVVWRVTQPALPLTPNSTMTLIYSTESGAANSYYVADFSHFTGNLAAGTALYAQVDSSNASSSYGVVLESHELNGGSYNNILGPVSAR